MLPRKKWGWSKVSTDILPLNGLDRDADLSFSLLNINRWGTEGLCRSTQWLSKHNSTKILPVWEADLCCAIKEESPHKLHPVWERRLCSGSDQSDHNQSPEYPFTAPPYILQLLHDEARVQTQGMWCWQMQYNGINSQLNLTLEMLTRWTRGVFFFLVFHKLRQSRCIVKEDLIMRKPWFAVVTNKSSISSGQAKRSDDYSASQWVFKIIAERPHDLHTSEETCNRRGVIFLPNLICFAFSSRPVFSVNTAVMTEILLTLTCYFYFLCMLSAQRKLNGYI